MRTLGASLLITLAVAALAAGVARGDAKDPEILRGLTEVALRVEELPPEAAAAGVGAPDLAARLKARLGAAALPDGDGGPQLVLSGRVFHLKAAGLYAYSVELTLEEDAVLMRTPAKVAACTWSTATLGTALSGNFRDAFVAAAERLADRFADEYLSVNPKP